MIILASNSPRRRMLLSLQGWHFAVRSCSVDERPFPGETPGDYVVRLAVEKSLSVSRQVPPDWLVIGADTTVVDGDEILGKPEDSLQAEAMLQRLRGRSHQVLTGLAVRRAVEDQTLTDFCVTQVVMRLYSQMEVRAYIASGDPLDKAGAYAIQHSGFNPVERIVGCYANVVGLPLCQLTKILSLLGEEPELDLTRDCLTAQGYDCKIRSLLEEA